jgi:GTP pyrophosphokinase
MPDHPQSLVDPAALNKKEDGSAQNSPEAAYEKLLMELEKYMPGFNRDFVDKAYKFAASCHCNQKRLSGEAYITHPIAVASIVASIKLDIASVVAALLHDVVEDTGVSSDTIKEQFGEEVAILVDGLTKINKIEFRSNQEKLAENFRKMILAMSKDLRVILIKLCDRLHNMRTISSMPSHKIKSISQETLDIYAPLANRLGIYNIKSELEDHCLRQLKYDVYQDLRNKIAAKKSERQSYIEEVKTILENEMKKYGFKSFDVYGRPKHFYSIYKKMTERHLEFEDVHDLFAFRIIVDNIKDCYEALGVVHAMWKPMPGRFKDYIAMPKANMYQSLHTTVIRPNGEPAEIQIRTREMHETCEFGVAAHWAYKEKNLDVSGQTDLQKFSWLRQIVKWQNELQDPSEFLEAVKVDLFDEEIFVFTPKGDVMSLPQNSTALDFAFAIHTNVGLKTVGSKVNGRIAPIKKTLKSGDIVEILTSPNQRPSKDWLNFVITSKARNRIRSYLRSEQRDRSKQLGRDFLIQQLEKRHLSWDAIEKNSTDMQKIIKLARESTFEDVLIALGYGRLNAADLVNRAFPEPIKLQTFHEQVDKGTVQEVAEQTKSVKAVRKTGTKGILVSGHEDVLVNFGRCCNPLPGEEIIGTITRGRGVTVHRIDCPRSLDSDPARRIDVQWGAENPNVMTEHKAFLNIVMQDRPGILAEVTGALSKWGANIVKMEAQVSKDLAGNLSVELGVRNSQQLEDIIRSIEGISAVISVERHNQILQNKQQKKKRR